MGVAERSSLPVLTQETPQASNWYSANNQISRFTYDPAGNLLQTCNNSFAACQSTQLGVMNRNFTYDAENRQVTANINGLRRVTVTMGTGCG